MVVFSLAHTRDQINTNDLNSQLKYDEGEEYNQCKLGNVMFTRELVRCLNGTGVRVNALHPRIVSTELTRHMSLFNVFTR